MMHWKSFAWQSVNITTKLNSSANQVRGQHANTRAASELQATEQEKRCTVELYCHDYSVLQHLGLASDDQSLQPLHNDQLFMKDPTKPAELGDNQKEDPWFWQVERCYGSGIENQEWAIESKTLSAFNGVLILTEVSGPV